MSETTEVRVARIEERMNDTSRRVEAIEQQTAKLPTMCSDMCCIAKDVKTVLDNQVAADKRLTEVREDLTDRIDKTNDRVSTIEMQPAERWNTMTRTIFTTIVAAVAGGLVTMLAATLMR